MGERKPRRRENLQLGTCSKIQTYWLTNPYKKKVECQSGLMNGINGYGWKSHGFGLSGANLVTVNFFIFLFVLYLRLKYEFPSATLSFIEEMHLGG